MPWELDVKARDRVVYRKREERGPRGSQRSICELTRSSVQSPSWPKWGRKEGGED